MSTLTIDLFSSLDGFAAAEDWPGYWGKAFDGRMQLLRYVPTLH